MSDWEKKIDDERDEQDIRIRLMNIDLLRDEYSKTPENDFLRRKELLNDLKEKYNRLLIELSEDDKRVHEANIGKNWVLEEEIKITEAQIDKTLKEKESDRDDRD